MKSPLKSITLKTCIPFEVVEDPQGQKYKVGGLWEIEGSCEVSEEWMIKHNEHLLGQAILRITVRAFAVEATPVTGSRSWRLCFKGIGTPDLVVEQSLPQDKKN